MSPTDAASRFDERPEMTRRRAQMVDRQIAARDITDERVLEAMRRVPRHAFVDDSQQSHAYEDRPLPIGYGQTISQPYIVALMTQLATPRAGMTVLEIGTGCGYQTAILAELCERVLSIEIVPQLAESAALRLRELGYDNVSVRAGDGSLGWPEEAPFDVILAAAAPVEVPQPLLDQLATGGRLIIPVGGGQQMLMVYEKQADGTISERYVAPVAFVPMTGGSYGE